MSEYDETEFEREIKKEWPVEEIIRILWNHKAPNWEEARLNSETNAIYNTEIYGYKFMLKKRHKSYGLSEKPLFSVEMQKGNLPLINYNNPEEVKKLETLGKKIEQDIKKYKKEFYEKEVKEFKEGLAKLPPE